jgi:hypothetical protein
MDDGTVSLFFGGTVEFRGTREQILHVPDPRFPAIADLNRDGILDLLIPCLKDGVRVYWGSTAGYRDDNFTALPGIGTVSEQIADLNRDGYLDVIVCNLADLSRLAYHTINTYIYWGSPQGYSTKRRTEIPALGAHHATVADFNRDGYLDIFVSNYQSEYSRDLDSHIYWGNPEASYTVERRQALHIGSAAGVVSADFDGNGWVDLAISNHMVGGSHSAESPVLWNGPRGFSLRDSTHLPTVGPHFMTGVDWGNIYDRSPGEIYVSAAYDCGSPLTPVEFKWAGQSPSGSRVTVELRAAATREGLGAAKWCDVPVPGGCAHLTGWSAHRWWQYKLVLHRAGAASPVVRTVEVSLGR